MTHKCIFCGEQTDGILAPDSVGVGLCQDCWSDRHQSGLVEELASNEFLTPRVVAELQAQFYDVTDPYPSAYFTEVAAAYLTEIPHTTTIRQSSGEELTCLSESQDSDHWHVVKQPPGLQPDETGYAMALFPPVSEDYPVFIGVYLAGESIEDLNSTLADYSIDIS